MSDPGEKYEWHSLRLNRSSADLLVSGLYRLARQWIKEDELRAAEKTLRIAVGVDDDVDRDKCEPGSTSVIGVCASLALARLLRDQGRMLESETYFLKAVNGCMTSLPEDHQLLAVALEDYAGLLRSMSMPGEAMSLERRARECRSAAAVADSALERSMSDSGAHNSLGIG